MPTYYYRAIGADGQFVEGNLESERLTEALQQLEDKNLQVAEIRELTDHAASPLPESQSFSESRSQRHEARTKPNVLHRELEAALERRDELAPGLEALAAELPQGSWRKELNQLTEILRKASSADDLIGDKRFVRWLPCLTVGLAHSSNTRGLADMMAIAAREHRVRNERRKVILYPLILFFIAVGILVALSVLVVPTFEEMFAEFGLAVPGATRLLFSISGGLLGAPIQTIGVLLAVGAVIYGLVWLWTHYAIGSRFFHAAVSGNAASVSAMASLTSHLAELLSINLPLPEALRIAGQGCEHYHYRKVAERLADDAERPGWSLAASPAAIQLPENLLYALQPGPDRQPNIPLLRQLARLYSERSSQRIDWVTGAMAQMAIIAIGLVVGFVVVALFSPLVSLVSGLS